MKNLLITLLIVVSFSFIATTTKFEKGFNDGYKNGWCYEINNCIEPIVPIAPIPNINESDTSYTDGYNRGFTKGKIDKESN